MAAQQSTRRRYPGHDRAGLARSEGRRVPAGPGRVVDVDLRRLTGTVPLRDVVRQSFEPAAAILRLLFCAPGACLLLRGRPSLCDRRRAPSTSTNPPGWSGMSRRAAFANGNGRFHRPLILLMTTGPADRRVFRNLRVTVSLAQGRPPKRWPADRGLSNCLETIERDALMRTPISDTVRWRRASRMDVMGDHNERSSTSD